MARTFVMSDIHGYYDQYLKMLKRIEFNTKDTLVILGDVIDRGPKSMDLLKHIRTTPNIHLLRGNHEQLMIDALLNEQQSWLLKEWLSNGGESTYRQYNSCSPKEKQELLDFLLGLPYYKDLGDYFLVHAGLRFPECNKSYILEELDKVLANKDDMLWIRQKYYNSCSVITDRIIVHGHTPVQYMNGKTSDLIYKHQNGICIDCGIEQSGCLSCLELYSEKEYYVRS